MKIRPFFSAFILALSLSAGGCTLLGAEYKSTSTEVKQDKDLSDRVKSLESRIDRLERKIDRLEERQKR